MDNNDVSQISFNGVGAYGEGAGRLSVPYILLIYLMLVQLMACCARSRCVMGGFFSSFLSYCLSNVSLQYHCLSNFSNFSQRRQLDMTIIWLTGPLNYNPINHLSRLMTKPTSTQSDQSSLCAQWVAKDSSFLHANSEDSDQTGRTDHFVSFVMRWLNSDFK